MKNANADTSEDKPTFADFEVRPEIISALSEQSITHPFPIQALTLPVALGRRDIIGQAKTGTGKTLGFGIPMLQHVVGPKNPEYDNLSHPGLPQALVVLPTRELCKQVGEDLRRTAKHLSVRVVDIYGGVAFEPQVAALKRGADIIVGTPGRLLDLSNRKILNLSQVSTIVLDEADEMLDLGFLPDVEKLLSRVKPDRHVMLFSATMPGPVIALARRFMTQPTHIRTQDPDDQGATVTTVKQFAYRCHALNKAEVAARILQAEGRGRTIIFTRTKRNAATLSEELSKRGFAVAPLHGDLGQSARERALRAFRNGKVDVLIATDVAARGIDVEDVTHVINFQCPEDDKTYLHRIGRTGRAGASGTAITFVDWDDVPRWGLISQTLELDIAEPVETYHTSDHLYDDLNIPTNVTDRLPRSQRTREGLRAEVLEDVEAPRRQAKRRRGGGRKPSGGGKEPGRAANQKPQVKNSGKQRGTSQEGRPKDEAPQRRRRRRRVNVHRDGSAGSGSAGQQQD